MGFVEYLYQQEGWNCKGDMPPPARGCLPEGRRGSPKQPILLVNTYL